MDFFNGLRHFWGLVLKRVVKRPVVKKSGIWKVTAEPANNIFNQTNNEVMAIEAPKLTSVSYNGQLVQVSWKPVDGSDVEYGATLYATDGSFSANSPLTAGLSTSITAQLDVKKTYEVKVQAFEGGEQGPFSTPAPIVQESTQLNSLSYSGSEITLRWDSSNREGAVYAATVFSTDGSSSYSAEPTTDLNATITQQLDPAKTYQAQVVITEGISSGPNSTVIGVITEVPELNELSYNLTNTTIKWDTVAVNAVEYAALLYATDGSYSASPPPTTELETTVTKTLDDSKTYKAQVQAQSGISQGPFSDAVAVITAQPDLNDLEYDLTDTTIKWNAVTVDTVEYAALLYATDGSYSASPPPTPELEATVTKTLDDSKTYKAQVQAQSGISKGPFSDAVAVITARPSLNDLEYNDKTTTLKWDGVTIEGADYIATVFSTDGSFSQSSVASADLEAEIDHELDSSLSYQGVSKAVMGISKGPDSTAVGVVTSLPDQVEVNYDGSNISTSWQADGSSGITGYIASLYENGTASGDQPVTGTDASFNQVLSPGVIFTVQVRSVSGISKGPYTDASYAPYAMSSTMEYDKQGRLISRADTNNWTYTYTLDPPGNITNVEISQS